MGKDEGSNMEDVVKHGDKSWDEIVVLVPGRTYDQ
jgi:hypothetical protein